MKDNAHNRTVIIKTECIRQIGTLATFTLAFDKPGSTVEGEIQELSFDDLCEIDRFLHAYVSLHQKERSHE